MKKTIIAALAIAALSGCASIERQVAETIALSQTRTAQTIAALPPMQRPVFDSTRVTITYKTSAGEHPGERETGLHNNASWEWWDNHPTFFLMGKDGAVIKMPQVGTHLVQRGNVVEIR